MTLNYNEMEQRISNDIKETKSQLELLYKTVEEANEYGYDVAFNANNDNESYKSAFEAGRAIGELEGRTDQLNSFLNFLYSKEFEN